MPSSLRASLLVTALVGVGCSAPTVEDIADANGGMTEGVVVVERLVSGDGTPQTNVSAKFMHLSAGADLELAERVVGARLEMPRLGTCMPMLTGSLEKAASLASLGPIELFDVGDVTLRLKAESSRVPLAARAFPEVGDLVSGVFYTSRDTVGALTTGATYVLENTGSTQIDRFSIETESPPAPEDVRVGASSLAEGLVLEDGVDTPIRWHPGETGRADVVVVDISGSSGIVNRCAFRDEGAAVIPGAMLRAAPLGGVGSIATFTFHRIRRHSFGAPGLDAGEVRFDFATIGRATLAHRAFAQP